MVLVLLETEFTRSSLNSEHNMHAIFNFFETETVSKIFWIIFLDTLFISVATLRYEYVQKETTRKIFYF